MEINDFTRVHVDFDFEIIACFDDIRRQKKNIIDWRLIFIIYYSLLIYSLSLSLSLLCEVILK